MSEKSEPVEMPRQVHAAMKLEMEAISASLKLFEKLSPEGQQRAFLYLGNVLGLSKMIPSAPAAKGSRGSLAKSVEPKEGKDDNIPHDSLADLYHAAHPETGADKVLVGGYWCQVCEGKEEFSAQVVNDQLKEIGAKVANVTVAFNALKAANPSLVLQVRKSGKSQQARKLYKLTVAGIHAVEEMICRE
jgi:hypothetical protein